MWGPPSSPACGYQAATRIRRDAPVRWEFYMIRRLVRQEQLTSKLDKFHIFSCAICRYSASALQRGEADHVFGPERAVPRNSIRHIQSTLVGQRFERVREADHSLGGAEHQIAIVRHLPRDTVEHGNLGVLIEVDQDVPTEHHIESAQRREIIEQIE